MKHTVSLKQNHLFRRLYQKGRSAVTPCLAVYCRKNGGSVSRLGITAGVKLGCAVQRNRVRRRIREIYQSIGLIRQAVQKIPEGPIAVPVKGNPNGEHFMRIEQPRGEAVYYVKGSGSKFIDRFRLRTPTTSNIPPMLDMLKGCQLADVPLLILTIDPCISCTER